ncbi:hypothetical protein [Gordonia sp. (in: high G+C Gram-positive bacteria)]|uniref:hypothetical protein n=1 Tax=Gordonia sp. (in: high G+C Gram-positive bacteria) TaxID=84139 RepID=UPI002FD9DFE9
MTLLHDEATGTRGAGTDAAASVTTRAGRRAGRTVGGERASRSASAQRAIDRRARRIARSGGNTTPHASRGARNRRVPLVVPFVLVLVAGLGLSLWLSTKAAQDSYRLGAVRSENQKLSDRVDTLKQTFESGDSAAALSDKAGKLGMIPSDNPPRMIVGADGKRRVVGELSPAQGRSLPSINAATKTEDPLAKIDKTKVDDSNGLGDAGGSGQAQSGQTPSGQTHNGQDRSATADTSGAQPNSQSPPVSATSTNTPAPNVLPTPAPNVLPTVLPTTVSNPPDGNSGQPR